MSISISWVDDQMTWYIILLENMLLLMLCYRNHVKRDSKKVSIKMVVVKNCLNFPIESYTYILFPNSTSYTMSGRDHILLNNKYTAGQENCKKFVKMPRTDELWKDSERLYVSAKGRVDSMIMVLLIIRTWLQPAKAKLNLTVYVEFWYSIAVGSRARKWALQRLALWKVLAVACMEADHYRWGLNMRRHKLDQTYKSLNVIGLCGTGYYQLFSFMHIRHDL